MHVIIKELRITILVSHLSIHILTKSYRNISEKLFSIGRLFLYKYLEISVSICYNDIYEFANTN